MRDGSGRRRKGGFARRISSLLRIPLIYSMSDWTMPPGLRTGGIGELGHECPWGPLDKWQINYACGFICGLSPGKVEWTRRKGRKERLGVWVRGTGFGRFLVEERDQTIAGKANIKGIISHWGGRAHIFLTMARKLSKAEQEKKFRKSAARQAAEEAKEEQQKGTRKSG